MTIYVTQEWNAYGKQNYSHYEYRLENNRIVKYRCRRQKVFDSHESSWHQYETIVTSWAIDDPAIPDWLRKRIP